jgi:hypothetical protein
MKVKTKIRFKSALILLALMATTFVACDNDDDDDPTPTPPPTAPASKTFNLKTKDVLGITGTVTFTEKSSTETIIDITLTGAAAGTHPAHIHYTSAAEGGAIALTLNPVDATGKSSTTVTKLDDNTPLTYTQFIGFDGYVNVHESMLNLTTILAQGDIGGNVLAGTSETYTLSEANASGVSGTALLEKRENGNALLTISLTGTIAGGSHPAEVRLGSVTTVGGGPITITLNNVDGATGKSYTTIRKLDSGTAIGYDGMINYDGYLTVDESILNPTQVIAQGNIGSNN